MEKAAKAVEKAAAKTEKEKKDWEKEGEPVLNFTFVQYAFSPLWHFCEIVRLEKSLESLFLDFHPRLP